MAFGWDDLAIIGASLYGGMASQDAAKGAGKGGKNALAEQQRQYNIGLAMLEPQRGLGYGALSDIASLYGYALPQYTPLNALGAGGGAAGTAGVAGNGTGGNGSAIGTAWTVGSPIKVSGRKSPGTTFGVDSNPFSGGNRRFGGTIDPVTGTVQVDAKKNQIEKNARATAYLRGEGELGGKFKRIRNAIDALHEQGYSWSDAPAPQTAGPTGQAGNFSRFFASPDYEFRRAEGTRGIEQGAAARGGALSGNALRALADYSSNLASGEFGNYMNRLFNIAGMGQSATTQGVNAGQNYAANAGNLMQGIGDARASGIMGQANSYASGINSLLNYNLLRQRLGSGGSYTLPSDIADFQYPFDTAR